jgi:putative tricarboxylic transport membrane protein
MEYFALSFFSLTMVAGLSGKSIMKGMVSACIGMMLAMVGAAPIDGYARFTLGFHAFDAGFNLLPALVGLFAVSEVLKTAKTAYLTKNTNLGDTRIKGFGFSLKEFISQIKNMFVSAFLGVGIGILPGIGGGSSNIIAYGVAKNSSKHPEKFGTGIIDGVVASETANNASIGGAMVPLLTLGIPGDTITAVLLGAFMLHGLQPGPMLFQNNSGFVYAIFAAMIIAAFMMLFVELVFIRGFVKVLNIPKYLLIPIILVLCVVGAFAVNNRIFDIWVFLGFGIVGAFLSNSNYPLAPVILGFLLGPYVELYFMRGMQLTRGNFIPFLTSPISGIFILVAILTFILGVYRNLRERKRL